MIMFMVSRLAFISICFTLLATLSGCATYDPKVGMTYDDYESMNVLSINGKPSFVERLNGFDIYQKSDAVLYKSFGEKISDNLDRYFYFKDKKLVIIKSRDEYFADKNKVAAEQQRQATLALKIEQDKRDRDNAAKKLISDKNEKDKQIAKQKAQQALEQCLNNDQVGICQSTKCDQNVLVSLLNSNFFCYTSNFQIHTVMIVKNNTSNSIKDIKFECTQYARSGTNLKNNLYVIYDVWGVNQFKQISLDFIRHEQAASMNCKATNWK